MYQQTDERTLLLSDVVVEVETDTSHVERCRFDAYPASLKVVWQLTPTKQRQQCF